MQVILMKLSSLLISYFILMICTSAWAESVNIVAIGASFTSGRGLGKYALDGVDVNHAYPAQLEAMLKGRGIDAHVRNAGVSGDTSGGIYGRLNSEISEDTNIAIVDISIANDRVHGVYTAGYVSKIFEFLKSRRITAISLRREIKSKVMHNPALMDGTHPNEEGQRVFAEVLLPQVLAVLHRH
jgi:acyl-CoA thioesterase-1